jgi:hypothetical protein
VKFMMFPIKGSMGRDFFGRELTRRRGNTPPV